MGCLVVIASCIVLFIVWPAYGLGWGVLSITVMLVPLWAGSAWLQRNRTQKEQLEREKGEIIAMIDKGLEEKKR